MVRRRSGTRVPKSLQRKYEWQWAGLFGQINMADGSLVATWLRVPASAVDNANSAGIPIQIADDYTLIRTRSNMQWSTDNGGAQVAVPWIACAGIIAWEGTTDDTNDIGVLPDPYWDQDLDWIWRSDGPSVLENFPIRDNAGDLDAYQSRAMRKLSAGTGLLWVFTIADPLDSGLEVYVRMAMNTRMLFKNA